MNILFGVYSGMVLGASSFVIGSALGQNPIVFMTGFASATVLSTIFFTWLAVRGYISVVEGCAKTFGRFVDIQSIFTFIQAFNAILAGGLNPVQPPQRPRVNRMRRREVPVPPVQPNGNAEVPMHDFAEVIREDDNDEIVALQPEIINPRPDVVDENQEANEVLLEPYEQDEGPDAVVGDEDN